MKSAIKSCLLGMLITCLLNTAVISMDAPSSPPRALSPLVNFSAMNLDQVTAFIDDSNWENRSLSTREASEKRFEELKAAAGYSDAPIAQQPQPVAPAVDLSASNREQIYALRQNYDHNSGETEYVARNQEPLSSPTSRPSTPNEPLPLLPQADPNDGKDLRPSRFVEWCNHARANKMRSAAIVAGVVFGSDLIYAYYSKITPEEQSKGFARKLLLAVSRTKTAALLGGSKNMVGSLLSRKKA